MLMGFKFGHPNMPPCEGCCGKPRACTATHAGCLYPNHPAKKRARIGTVVGAYVELEPGVFAPNPRGPLCLT